MKALVLSEPLALDATPNVFASNLSEMASFACGFRLILANEARQYCSSHAISESLHLFYKSLQKELPFVAALSRIKYESRKSGGSHRSIVLNNGLVGIEVVHVSALMPVMLKASISHLLLVTEGAISIQAHNDRLECVSSRQLAVARNDGALLKAKSGADYQISTAAPAATLFLVRLK